MNGSDLSVKMLGGFSVSYRGKELALKFGNTTKAMQILQLLIYHAPQKVTSYSMLEQLFGYDDIINPNNNLKVSISQLRKRLNSLELPCKDFVSFKDGCYYWSCPLSMEVDVHAFEQKVKDAEQSDSEEEEMNLYREACALYQGDFLPHLVGVDWAVVLNAYYYEIFSKAVHRLSEMLLDRKMYEETLSLATRAYSVRHMEQWQVLKIRCLMEMGRWQEAKHVYQETVNTLNDEIDVPPSQELMDQYRAISEKTNGAACSFQDMLEALRENKEINGAYFCAFPGFIDTVRVMSRNMARSGVSSYLMLFFIGDRNGNAVQSEDKLAEANKIVFEAIRDSLRKGDIFTQYNKSQFLVFLFGTCRENCEVAAKRIERNYRKNSVRGAALFYEVTSAALDLPVGTEINSCDPE